MLPEYIIQNNLKITAFMSAFEVIYNDDFFFNGENHNFWECVFVIDGKVGATADEKIHELSKDEIIFHKPMEFHKLWASSGTKPHLFIMSFIAEGECINLFKDGVFKLTTDQRTHLEQLFQVFRSQTNIKHFTTPTQEYLKIWHDKPYLTQMIGNYFENFLLSLASNLNITQTVTNNKNAVLYEKIVHIMEEHIHDWITLSQIAEEVNMSVSNLKKVFSKYSNYSIYKYFLKLKIIRAIELLKKGLSVSEISDSLSFNNQNYFSIVFKRETGYAPLNYKKQFLKS